MQSLDEAALKSLSGADVGVQATAGNGFTYRHDWGSWNGQVKLNLTCRGSLLPRASLLPSGKVPAVAASLSVERRYSLYNVAPDTGHVEIWVNIVWGSPISLIADYLIIEPQSVT